MGPRRGQTIHFNPSIMDCKGGSKEKLKNEKLTPDCGILRRLSGRFGHRVIDLDTIIQYITVAMEDFVLRAGSGHLSGVLE
jgi:hypothetical protein